MGTLALDIKSSIRKMISEELNKIAVLYNSTHGCKVALKGIEMPDSCAECIYLHDTHGRATCRLTYYAKEYKWNPETGRMESCPLVPLETNEP